MNPRATARLAGGLYLTSAIPAGFSILVLFQLVVRSDPAATAARILASEGLFRLGLVADLIGILFFVAAVLFLYELFKPLSRTRAQLFLFFGLIGSGIQALDALWDLAALMLLKGGPTLAALPAEQSRSLAFLFLRLHTLGYDLAFVFFGSALILLGTLILKSTFMPRVIGAMVAIDGAGYLTFALATYLSPPLAVRLHPFLPFVTAAIGELPLVLWLLVKGVDATRWEAQAAAARPQPGDAPVT